MGKKNKIKPATYRDMWNKVKEISGTKDPEYKEIWPLLDALEEIMSGMEEGARQGTMDFKN